MRWKACNSTLMAVYSLLLQLAAALCAHHECRTVLLSAQLLGAFSLVSRSAFEQFFAYKGALDAPSHGLGGGARSAAVAHVSIGGGSIFVFVE